MKVLVIGAHADDPEIAMGGTIANLIKNGHEVKLLICIIPCEARNGDRVESDKITRWKYQKNSILKLGATVKVLDYDPYTFTFNRELVKAIDKEVVDFQPNCIFTHWEHDSHQDHNVVAKATFAATRENTVSVLMYDLLSLGGITPHSFKSDIYVDISDTIEQKIKSVECYKFLSKETIDAIYSIARFRGTQIGVQYAECFQVCKIISPINESGLTISSVDYDSNN